MKLFYRRSADTYRVWQENWGGDQFEVFNVEDFSQLLLFCNRLSIRLIEKTDDDD